MLVRQSNLVVGLLALVLLAACAFPAQLKHIAPIVATEPEAPLPVEAPGLERSGRAVEKDQDSTVELGFHYKPTQDGTTADRLAQQAQFVILHNHEDDLKFRRELRNAGYKGTILQYILSNEVDGPKPGKTCDTSFVPWRNNMAYRPDDFCRHLNPNEDWFLHNGDGERLIGRYQERYYYRMNPASEGWRKFSLERLAALLYGDEDNPPLGFDGYFFDNVELSSRTSRRNLPNSDGTIREFDSEESFRKAWRSYLEYMHSGLGEAIPLWANLVASTFEPDDWNDYLPHLDGVMNEAFATGYTNPLSRERQTAELAQVENALKRGVSVYAVSQGSKDNAMRQTFALASYLLVIDPEVQSYFRYTRANDGSYTSWWLYDNYNVHLGEPLGPRYKVRHGWRRDFERGYVVVDQVERRGRIVETANS